VFRRELAALKMRLDGHRIDRGPLKQWNAISAAEMGPGKISARDEAIGTRREPEAYFSNALFARFNTFDPEAIVAQVREFNALPR
jgi:hypothetical protein